MFIIFGWDNKANPLESLLTTHCAHCQKQTGWTLWKDTTWGSLFFIRLLPIMDTYHLRCDGCGYTLKIPGTEAKAALDRQQRNQALHDHLVNLISQDQDQHLTHLDD